jgi:hypothetical protein
MAPEAPAPSAARAGSWLPRFDGSVVPARPAVLARALYLLLALDLWVDMIPHAGRYGVDGFNVAHFAWLDALLPLPSAAGYAGLLAATGVLSAMCALGPLNTLMRWAVAFAYTLGWAMSMHDSYQHHYLLSWLLLALAIAPVPTGLPSRSRVWAPGHVLLSITCGVVYTFTAVSKLSPAWRDGSVLRTLAHARPPGDPHPGRLDALRDAALGLGVSDARFFAALALATAALQVLIAAGYLTVQARDERGHVRARSAGAAALAGAFLFHLGAEVSGVFRIGWFSLYMMVVAAVCLGPAALVAALDDALARASSRVRSRLGARGALVWALAALAWGGAIALIAHGRVPGFAVGAATGGLGALGLGALARRGQRALAPAVAASALLAACAVTFAPVAFDYHRRLAGELLKLGRHGDALAAYREAERVAPPGQSRRGKIRALEAHEPKPPPPPERP